MKNQVYKLNDGKKDASILEFFIVDTNKLNPTRDIKEVGIVVMKEGMQLDFDLDEDSIKSLIKYLDESLDYIKDFNDNSEPEETEQQKGEK